MILVNPRVGNIVAGYDRICHIDRTLPTQWRNRLLVTYAHRWNIYTDSLARPSRVFRRGLALAAILIFLGVGLGMIGFITSRQIDNVPAIFWTAYAAILSGLVIGFVMLVYGAQHVLRGKPPPPQHPHDANLIEPLLPHWRDELRWTLPAPDPNDYGAAAEQSFVKFLSDLDSSFVFYRLQQRSNEDADVIVVGQKGLWVFEVKHWQGKIAFRNGNWERDERLVWDERGNVKARKPRPVSQPPDELWQRECRDITVTLQRRARQVLNRVPALTHVNGGIVFTHPDATYSIADLPVAWDKPVNWKQKLAAAPILPGMDERASLQVIDALLAWCQEVTDRSATLSMDRVAKQLGQQAEARLSEWMDGPAK